MRNGDSMDILHGLKQPGMEVILTPKQVKWVKRCIDYAYGKDTSLTYIDRKALEAILNKLP